MSAAGKEKFFARAVIAGSDQCWQWMGEKGGGGKMYGTITLRSGGGKTQRYAHRIAKELAIGRSLATDENLHHSCRHTLCVNPSHLLIVSRSEHKSQHDRRTHCKRGHEYGKVLENGQQVCLVCRREQDSERRKQRRLNDPEWREKQRQRMKDYHARRRDVGK